MRIPSKFDQIEEKQRKPAFIQITIVRQSSVIVIKVLSDERFRQD